MKNRKIILGSSSIWRQEVLSQAGFEFTVETADIDEKVIRHNDPQTLTSELAVAKAEAILKKIPVSDSILITCDQVVVCNGAIREKPESEEEAREFLKSYALYPAYCVNGIAVTSVATKKQIVGNQTSKVVFYPISDEVIEQLIKDKKIMGCSGAFICEHPLLSPYVKEIEGGADSVSGLPLEYVLELIKKLE